MHIELRQLRYVVAAAEHESFRKAARALGIAESAISRRIAALEAELGTRLFVRDRSGAKLTYAGQRFVARARGAINQIGHAAKDAGAIAKGHDGIIRVGVFSSLASGFLAELFEAFVSTNPGVQLDFIEAPPSKQITGVRGHRIDVGFLTGHAAIEGCEAENLWCERPIVVLPLFHPLAKNNEIQWADLRGESFVVSEVPPGPEIHDYIVKHLSDVGHHPPVERHAVYRDTLLQIVAIGRGLTLTSEATTGLMSERIVYRPLVADRLPFSVIWSARNENPALHQLLEAARALSRTSYDS